MSERANQQQAVIRVAHGKAMQTWNREDFNNAIKNLFGDPQDPFFPKILSIQDGFSDDRSKLVSLKDVVLELRSVFGDAS